MVLSAAVVENFFRSVTDFSLNNLLPASILLVIGYIIGRIVGGIVKEILIRAKVDKYVSAKGLFKVSDIFSLLAKWAIYLIFIWASVQQLGIQSLTLLMETIVLGFIPGLIKALIVIFVGYLIADYVRTLVEKSEVSYSDIISKALFWFIIYIAVAIALPLIGIDTTLVNSILLILIGSFGLGIAIAMGLGLKDTVTALSKQYIKNLQAKKRRK